MFALATAILVIACLAPEVALAKLERVWVLQRHGARAPLGIADGKLQCEPPFCELTDEGRAQCRSLGRTLHDHYAAPLNLGSAAEAAKHRRIRAQSTESGRVIESVTSTLEGLFPGDNSKAVEVSFTKNVDDVDMKYWESWPSWKLTNGWWRIAANLTRGFRAVVDQSDVAKYGALFQLPEAVCRDPKTAVICAGAWIDFFFSYAMTEPAAVPVALPEDPEFQELSKRLRAVFLAFINAYFPDDFVEREMGSYCFLLAQRMMRELTEPGRETVLELRGAHDWTTMAFYATLGFWNPSRISDAELAIDFAEAVVVERHSHSAGADTLVFHRWSPGQKYDPEHRYDVARSVLGVRCETASGIQYFSNESNDGCSLEDVWRAINSTGPKSPLGGPCYATPQLLASHHCLSAAEQASPSPGSVCAFYRDRCGGFPFTDDNGDMPNGGGGVLDFFSRLMAVDLTVLVLGSWLVAAFVVLRPPRL